MAINWIHILIIAGSFGVGFATRFIPGLKPDNPIEEKCEEIIHEEIGLELDFTPDSPETDDANKDIGKFLDFKR